MNITKDTIDKVLIIAKQLTTKENIVETINDCENEIKKIENSDLSLDAKKSKIDAQNEIIQMSEKHLIYYN